MIDTRNLRVIAQDGNRFLTPAEREVCWMALWLYLDDADLHIGNGAEDEWQAAFDALVALKADREGIGVKTIDGDTK